LGNNCHKFSLWFLGFSGFSVLSINKNVSSLIPKFKFNWIQHLQKLDSSGTRKKLQIERTQTIQFLDLFIRSNRHRQLISPHRQLDSNQWTWAKISFWMNHTMRLSNSCEWKVAITKNTEYQNLVKLWF
jgi:hypothetical protein